MKMPKVGLVENSGDLLRGLVTLDGGMNLPVVIHDGEEVYFEITEMEISKLPNPEWDEDGEEDEDVPVLLLTMEATDRYDG